MSSQNQQRDATGQLAGVAGPFTNTAAGDVPIEMVNVMDTAAGAGRG